MQHRARSFEILMGLAIWIFASSASAQATPGPSRIQQSKEKAIPVVSAPVQPQVPVAAQVPQPVAPAPEQAPPPPQPPVVTWADKKLTVDAENSTLTDILLAIRTLTGASVEIPASAASERVALHIGPAPIREVLSTLLYGTNFDYVIQAADDDPDVLRSVILTAGGVADDAPGSAEVGTAASLSAAAAAAKKPGMRLMKGWAAPGKPAFQASAEAALAAPEAGAAQDADSSAESASSSADTTNSPADSATASKESVSANSKAAASTDPQSGASAASSADANSLVETDIPPAAARASSSSSSDSNDQSGVSQSIQNMQRLYEQRRQIQAQQNQAAQQQPAAN